MHSSVFVGCYSCHSSSAFSWVSCMSAHFQGLSKKHQVLVWALCWTSFSSVWVLCSQARALRGLRGGSSWREELLGTIATDKKSHAGARRVNKIYHKSQEKRIGCFYCWCYFGCFSSTKLFSQYYADGASCYCKVNLSTGSWLLHWGTCSAIWKPSNCRCKAATLWIPFEVPWNKYYDFILLFWLCELCQSSEFQKCVGL